MGLLSFRPLIDLRTQRTSNRQAKRLADERKVSHVYDRNANRNSISTSLRAAACARVSIRSLLLEGR
jgi:hypothetical protein